MTKLSDKGTESLKKLIDYMWTDELKHYEEQVYGDDELTGDLEKDIQTCEQESNEHHIFYDIMIVQKELNHGKD